jgi:hypothetical protein
MHGRASFASFSITLMLAVASPAAQLLVQTPLPTVTADNESWYVSGEPITHAGNVYLPAGAQIYFNANEMVRSGFYMGIPLYTRTTLEPYSVVFVPLAGGRMQPYERPRTGELTGTTGSIPSTLPAPSQTVPPAGLAPQAAGPPSQTTQLLEMQLPRPEVVAPTVAPPRASSETESTTPVVGTGGRAPQYPMHTQIGGRPQGSNSIFVEFADRRWYPRGSPEPIDTSRLTRIGNLQGFDVWGDAADRSVIYIPVTWGSTLAVRYTSVRPEMRD